MFCYLKGGGARYISFNEIYFGWKDWSKDILGVCNIAVYNGLLALQIFVGFKTWSDDFLLEIYLPHPQDINWLLSKI